MVQHSAIDHTLLTTVSYASNSNSVAVANAPGASTLVSRADHVHLGVRSITHTSNTFSGPVTLVAEGSIGITTPTSGTFAVSSVAGAAAGASTAAVGRQRIALPDFYDFTQAPVGANLGTSGGAAAVAYRIAAPMYLDAFRYRNFDTSTARSIEFGLFRDDGSASAVCIAKGTDSFTPSAASNRAPAFTSAPILVPPGQYWLVVRNTGGATNFQIGVQTANATNIGLVGYTTQTLGSALPAVDGTLDLTTGWTRTSTSILAGALIGRVFGESSVF